MIRYAHKSMTIDGIVFNQGDIIPESLYPAADVSERNAAAEKEQEAISNSSFPSEATDDIDEDDEDEDEEEDEETFEVVIPEGGSALDATPVLPTPEVDSVSPKVPKVDKKSGK